MTISPKLKMPIITGISIAFLHLFLCVVIFASVQSSADGQAGFVWFLLFKLDYPTGGIAYELLGSNPLMESLTDWWYTIGNGQGLNLRALILFGIFGTLH
jgi:hypothetical protein